MLMVFVSPSVSWEQAWALEIAEAQLVRNSHVFLIIPAAAAAPMKICGLLPDRRGIFSYS